MAPKRPRDDTVRGEVDDSSNKKARHGSGIAKITLPDGPWRRKVEKHKEELIHNAKLKKSYSKLKAELAAEKDKEKTVLPASIKTISVAASTDLATAPQATEDTTPSAPEGKVHPARQLNITQPPSPSRQPSPTPLLVKTAPVPTWERLPSRNDPSSFTTTTTNTTFPPSRRANYFTKAQALAAEHEAERQRKIAERAARNAERDAKLAQREKMNKRMLKAKGVGKDGRRSRKPKLGLESKVLLGKVRRMMGEEKR